MIDQNSRPARKVGIADHLWETYEDMAQQMGSDRDALINQALFMFARLNGFIEVARTGRPEVAVVASGGGASPSGARASGSAAGASKGAPPVLQPVAGGASKTAPPPREEHTPAPAPAPQRPSARVAEERAPANSLDNDPARREVAERVLETAAELERLIKGKSNEPREEIDEEPLPDDDADSGMGLAADDEPMDDEPMEDQPMDDEPMDESAGGALVLSVDNAEPRVITQDRFVIGRGKHCDLVIHSGKVSREHAVIVRDGDDFFIEDLGSSNGTWFNKQRIKRRKVEDGDEYFICSERVRLTYQ
ncbi:FHA domain-containing protein [Archangium sp.]|uniref:FHA domain-containing protein n=1 Tax=Archangium sp. TaxID=1872627 RepID=UPI002EDA8066